MQIYEDTNLIIDENIDVEDYVLSVIHAAKFLSEEDDDASISKDGLIVLTIQENKCANKT